MLQKDFAEKIVGCSQACLSQVLAGKRNFGYEKAEIVSKVLKTDLDLWINPKASVNDRVCAWDKFKS